MIKTTRSSWPSMVVGVVTLAVLLQGCLLAEKFIFDFYLAVIGIPDGVEQEITRTTFSLPGTGYCNDTPGSIFFSGNMSQSTTPLPRELYIKHTHLDALDNTIRVAGVNAMVDPQTGDFQGSSLDAILPGCFALGHKLIISVQPNGGDIAEGARVSTFMRYAF